MVGNRRDQVIAFAFCGFLALLVVVLALTWKAGFLSNGWRDALAVAGFVGVLLTVFGLWYSIRSLDLAAKQLDRTRSANEAATAAAIEAIKQSRRQYDLHLVNQAHALISATKIYVDQSNWHLAAMRLSDIADALTHLGIGDQSWTDMAKRTRTMEYTFNRIAAGEIPSQKSMMAKWRGLCRDLSAVIAERSAPFQHPIKEQTND
jgi:hypothetical protein